jgi:hypothetical protein
MAYRLRLEAAELHYPRTFGYRIKKGVSEARSNLSIANLSVKDKEGNPFTP